MNITVQMDKDEFDTLQKQANHNVESLRQIALDVAFKTLDELVESLQDPANRDRAQTMGDLADYLVKYRSQFGYVCLDKAGRAVDHVEPFVPIPQHHNA